jgi:hypothetical protein
MQAPLGAWSDQPIGHKHEQNEVPARAFAAGPEPLAPEPIQLQLLPQLERQPARAPLARPFQRSSRSSDCFRRTIEASGSTPSQRSAGNTGVVTPRTARIEYVVDIKRVLLRRLKLAIADGVVKADGEIVCTATDVTVGLAEIGVPGTNAAAA